MFESGSNGHTDGNKRWTLRAALAPGEDSAIARVVIDKAKAGDAVAARFVLGLLCPRPRGRTITLALPADMHAGDVMAAFDATLAALAVGKITPDEALTVTRVLEWRLKALKSYPLASERNEWARQRSAARAAAATKAAPSTSDGVQKPAPASQAEEGQFLHSACIRPASAAAPAVSPQSHSG
jgi:hypothetical protein